MVSAPGAWQTNGNGVRGVLDNPLSADGSKVMMISRSLESQVDMLEQRVIEDTLRRNNHRRKETAAELEISRVTLYNKMKKFGLLG
jgi:DNA-binding NtrC family response regulator